MRESKSLAHKQTLHICLRTEQINEIRKTTLARIICDNSDDIGDVQPDVFMLSNRFENFPIGCNNSVIDTIDLNALARVSPYCIYTSFCSWIDFEPHITLPISRESLLKAKELGQQRVLSDQALLALSKRIVFSSNSN